MSILTLFAWCGVPHKYEKCGDLSFSDTWFVEVLAPNTVFVKVSLKIFIRQALDEFSVINYVLGTISWQRITLRNLYIFSWKYIYSENYYFRGSLAPKLI